MLSMIFLVRRNLILLCTLDCIPLRGTMESPMYHYVPLIQYLVHSGLGHTCRLELLASVKVGMHKLREGVKTLNCFLHILKE